MFQWRLAVVVSCFCVNNKRPLPNELAAQELEMTAWERKCFCKPHTIVVLCRDFVYHAATSGLAALPRARMLLSSDRNSQSGIQAGAAALPSHRFEILIRSAGNCVRRPLLC